MYPLLDKNPVERFIWTVKQEEPHEGHVLSTEIYITVVFPSLSLYKNLNILIALAPHVNNLCWLPLAEVSEMGKISGSFGLTIYKVSCGVFFWKKIENGNTC